MKPDRRYLLSGLVRALCVLSLILAAFAHRPAFAYDPDAAAASFVFPDGSVASTCLNGRSDDGKHRGASGHCEFCRIAGNVAMPAPPGAAETCIVFARFQSPKPGDDTPARRALPTSAAPRGPPSIRT